MFTNLALDASLQTLTSPKALAYTSLWRRVFLNEEQSETQEEVEANGAGGGDRCYMEEDGQHGRDPIHNEQNSEIRQEFVNEMRVRDVQGRSLRSTSLVHNPTAYSVAEFGIPSAPGSQDYIYVPQ